MGGSKFWIGANLDDPAEQEAKGTMAIDDINPVIRARILPLRVCSRLLSVLDKLYEQPDSNKLPISEISRLDNKYRIDCGIVLGLYLRRKKASLYGKT